MRGLLLFIFLVHPFLYIHLVFSFICSFFTLLYSHLLYLHSFYLWPGWPAAWCFVPYM
jgi:hypothetical protein